MIISKAIRYLAERLGIKTTGTGISDAIMDLADGFPFGVETKIVNTVVFEDSFIARAITEQFTSGSPLEGIGVGNPCTITLNGTVYENIILTDHEGNSRADFGGYNIFCNATDEYYHMGGLTTGEGYALKIEKAEVQTVVKQLDPKFRGFGEETKLATVFTGNVVNDNKIDIGFDVVSGQPYIVKADGVEYNVTGTVYDATGDGIWVPTFADGEHKNAFNLNGKRITFTTVGNHTIEMYTEETVTTPIDIKYLPIDELKAALGLE